MIQQLEVNYIKSNRCQELLLELYNDRGVLYSDLGKREEALADYNKAIGLNPHYPEAYNNRGNLYKILGNDELAEQDKKRFRELLPTLELKLNTIQPLKQIHIRNLKSIENLEAFSLNKLNIFIGANGAGKSNLLQLFPLMQAKFDDELEKYIEQHGGIYSFIRNEQKNTPIQIETYFGNIIHRLDLVATASEKPFIDKEEWHIPEFGWLSSDHYLWYKAALMGI